MLTAHAGEETRTDGVGTHLTSKVNLYGRVNRHHLRVLTDTEWVVGPCHIFEYHVLVVVHEVIQSS